MATKIRRCLFIGLGGTGMTALLNTKRMFIDTYGDVPPMVGFLGFDTDDGEYRKTLKSKRGEEVKLMPNEQIKILVDNPKELYFNNKEHFSWVPEKNVFALTSMTRGAGQIRSNGRFAFTVNERQITPKLKQAVDAITNAQILERADQYEVLGSQVEIHIVFSISGGTGSGTFINMAYLCRKLFPQASQVKIVGYAVLADVFESFMVTGVSRVKPNAYGAIQDLDFLMHLTPGDKNNFEIDYLTHKDKVDSKPFDAVFLIDNKNANGDTYDHVDQLAEMISLALVTSSGELSAASESTIDNLSKNIGQGNMDVGDKRAWVSGLGVSEIIYSGKELSEIYAMKAAKKYINELTNSKEDGATAAAAWIDDPSVNIRENNNFDHVIDFMLSRTPKHPLEGIEDKSNPKPECLNYIERERTESGLEERLLDKTKQVKKSLHDLVVAHLNRDGGVGGARDILNSIQADIDIFLGEMESEKEDWKKKEDSLTSTLGIDAEDLESASGKLFNRILGKNIKEAESQLVDTTNNLVIAKREILRRDSAIRFYKGVVAQLNEELLVIDNIEKKLDGISEQLGKQIAAAQNNVSNRSRTFQIDLSSNEATQIQVEDVDVKVAEFVESLPSANKLYDYGQLDGDDLKEKLLTFTSKLPGAQNHATTTVDAILNKMDRDTLIRYIDLALAKSKVLLRCDNHGQLPIESPADCYYVGVADKERSRLKKDDLMEKRVQGNVGNFDFASTGMTDRVILYHQFGVVPAFAVAPIPTYEEKYNTISENTDCHFDYNIERAMIRQGYSLLPQKKMDDSVEIWILGFIFGLIKKDEKDGKFKIKSEQDGDALYDYWCDLAEYRDDAFNAFKSKLNLYRKDIESAINEFQKRKGDDVFRQRIEEAKESYRDKYVQIPNEELEKRGNEALASLVREEIEASKKLNL